MLIFAVIVVFIIIAVALLAAKMKGAKTPGSLPYETKPLFQLPSAHF